MVQLIGEIRKVVGADGFEPPTLCSQSRCATRLRHAPPDPNIVPIEAKPYYESIDGSSNGALLGSVALRPKEVPCENSYSS
ncbi:uncharacterized protein METZ01_LOCUS266915 [marine metagenome]|uniref:Uncharacterized protein n=1 Tax=marine metagenome TaxID=408172 RepID=A0A382JU20_9ZZZZ